MRKGSIISCLVLCLLARAAWGQSVRVREQAAVFPGAPIMLGDVAEITGEGSEALAGLVVSAGVHAGATVLTLEAIRTSLERDHQRNMGRISLSGGSVLVRVREVAPPPVQVPEPAVVSTPAIKNQGPTIRDAVVTALAQQAGVQSIEDVRAVFVQVDAGVLATPTAGLTVSVVPTARSSEVPVQVRAYAGEKLVLSMTLRVRLEVRRARVIAVRDLARGEPLDDTTCKIDEAFVAWGTAAREAQAVRAMPASGTVARRGIRAGEALDMRDVELPVLVKKGDVVSVDCVHRGFVVRASMRAMGDGREGEVVSLAALPANRGSRDSRGQRAILTATVVGAGRCVLRMDDQHEEQGS